MTTLNRSTRLLLPRASTDTWRMVRLSGYSRYRCPVMPRGLLGRFQTMTSPSGPLSTVRVPTRSACTRATSSMPRIAQFAGEEVVVEQGIG